MTSLPGDPVAAFFAQPDPVPDPPPEMPALRLGPWFTARFGSACDGCGDGIYEGDRSRSDGEDGWLCDACGSEQGEPED